MNHVAKQTVQTVTVCNQCPPDARGCFFARRVKTIVFDVLTGTSAE
jgi:hypothetical protein